MRVQIFLENFILLPPLKVNWIPLSTLFLTVVIDTPRQNKRHSILRMKMRPNQDVRGDAKKFASGYAMATPLAYARVYPEPRGNSLNFGTRVLMPSNFLRLQIMRLTFSIICSSFYTSQNFQTKSKFLGI